MFRVVLYTCLLKITDYMIHLFGCKIVHLHSSVMCLNAPCCHLHNNCPLFLVDTIELNLEEAPKSAKFIRGVGSQVMLHGASHQTGSLDMLEERGRKLLSEDEVLAVSRHIRRVSFTTCQIMMI